MMIGLLSVQFVLLSNYNIKKIIFMNDLIIFYILIIILIDSIKWQKNYTKKQVKYTVKKIG